MNRRHCVACDVSWVGEEPCFVCDAAGEIGQHPHQPLIIALSNHEYEIEARSAAA